MPEIMKTLGRQGLKCQRNWARSSQPGLHLQDPSCWGHEGAAGKSQHLYRCTREFPQLKSWKSKATSYQFFQSNPYVCVWCAAASLMSFRTILTAVTGLVCCTTFEVQGVWKRNNSRKLSLLNLSLARKSKFQGLHAWALQATAATSGQFTPNCF